LDDLERDGMVTRRVSADSGSYPPPVIYELSQIAVDRLAEFSEAAQHARSLFANQSKRRAYLTRRIAQQVLLAYQKITPSFNEKEALDKLIDWVYDDLLEDFSLFLTPVFEPSEILKEMRSIVLEMKGSGLMTVAPTFSLGFAKQFKKDQYGVVEGWLGTEVADYFRILAETHEVSREFESCLWGVRAPVRVEHGFPGIEAVADQMKMFVNVAPSYRIEKVLARFQDMLRRHPYMEGRPSDQTVLAAWGRLRWLYKQNIMERKRFIDIYKQNQGEPPSKDEIEAWHMLLGTLDKIYEKLRGELVPGRFTHTFNMWEALKEARDQLYRSPAYLNALSHERIILFLQLWRERALGKFNAR
jgi:hypothetical protein